MKTLYYVKSYAWDYNHEEYFPMKSVYYSTFQKAKEQYDAVKCDSDHPQIEIHRETLDGILTVEDVRVLMKESMEYGVEETIGE